MDKGDIPQLKGEGYGSHGHIPRQRGEGSADLGDGYPMSHLWPGMREMSLEVRAQQM